MKNRLIIHLSVFSVVYIVAFLCHNWVLQANYPETTNILPIAYISNVSVLVFLILIYFLLKNLLKHKTYVYYYIVATLKFILALLVLLPWLKRDGEIQKMEFLSFLIPYAIVLIYIVVFLTNVAQKDNK